MSIIRRWMNNFLSIHAMEYSSAIKRDLLLKHTTTWDEPQKLSAKWKKQAGKEWLIPFTYTLNPHDFCIPRSPVKLLSLKSPVFLVTKFMGCSFILILGFLQHLAWPDTSLFEISPSSGLSCTTPPIHLYSPLDFQSFSFKILSQASRCLPSTWLSSHLYPFPLSLYQQSP